MLVMRPNLESSSGIVPIVSQMSQVATYQLDLWNWLVCFNDDALHSQQNQPSNRESCGRVYVLF